LLFSSLDAKLKSRRKICIFMKSVAIIGRSNVGKSTFFNRLVKKRISITQDISGVTRDRVSAEVKWRDLVFELIDTGGLTFKESGIEGSIHEQAEVAIEESDLILFVVDGSAEILGEDEKAASILRKSGKPVYLVINKMDRLTKEPELIYNFYKLGFDNIFQVSSEHGTGFDDMMKELYPVLKDGKKDREQTIKIAISGRPNAGKSSLVNAILGSNRTIVSSESGTTRDTISTKFTYNNSILELLDTAGIRKKARVNEDIEYYSVVRAIRAIRDSNIVVMVIDAQDGVREQDQKIAGLASDASKPIIICLNKIDLVSNSKELIDDIKEKLKFTHATVVKISALTGKGVKNLLEKIFVLHEENNKRISTGILNNVLREILIMHSPPTRKGKRVKIGYGTQVSVSPPTFIIFCNDPDLVHFSYLRRIENGLRKAFGFEGVNIRIRLRKG